MTHNPNKYSVALFIVTLSLSALANSNSPEAAVAAEQQPVVSELGKRRIQENLELLDNSIADIKQNLASTKHNVKTIQAELSELVGLEKEHLELRRKYSNYLSFAKTELAKNDNTVRDLAKWEAQQKAAGDRLNDKQLQERLSAAKREQTERGVWKADAASKTERVQKLIVELDANLREIRSRKFPLERQLASWTKRQDEYQELLEKTSRKRKELDTLSKR